MRGINHSAYHSVFMALLLGMSVVAVFQLAYGATGDPADRPAWMMAGAGVYLFGVLLVTVVCNVPMNKRLDAVEQQRSGAYWTTRYVPRWTRWNSIRTGAAVLASICYLIACVQLSM